MKNKKAQYHLILKWTFYLLPLWAALYYYFTDVAKQGSFLSQCLLKKFTGWSCMACGGQRAFHQLLHGNFIEAIELNALFSLGLPLALYFYYNWINDNSALQKKSKSSLAQNSQRIIALLLLSILFMIVRNMPYFRDFLSVA